MTALGSIDILVNCPDLFMAKPIEEIADGEWERILSVNLSGVFFACRAVGPRMLKQERGRDHQPRLRAGGARPAEQLRLLRRQGGRHQPDAGAGAGVGGPRHHRELYRPRLDGGHAGSGRPQPRDEPGRPFHSDAAGGPPRRYRAARGVPGIRFRRLCDRQDDIRGRRPSGPSIASKGREMPKTQINGFQMNYRVEGEGPPLVMAHGLLAQHRHAGDPRRRF